MTVKMGIALALLTLVLGFSKWGHDKIFQAGVNSVHAELAEEFKIREQALNNRLVQALADNELAKTRATNLQVSLNKSQADSRKLRDEINDAEFECIYIGGDFDLLWNKASRKPTQLD